MRGIRPSLPKASLPSTTTTVAKFPIRSHRLSLPPPSSSTRCLHSSTPRRPIPQPTPFCPDPATFLTLIGRQLAQHAAKIPTWEALFSLSSPQLRALGIEPARSRRYLLRWRERFRHGAFGPGGDLQQVANGVAELKVVEVPVGEKAAAVAAAGGENGKKRLATVATATRNPGMRKVVVNVKPGEEVGDVGALKDAVMPSMVNLVRGHAIRGPYVEPVKGTNGSVARIAVKEGMWEQRRGQKVDGGERRKAEVRAKRRSQERKDTR
ncbi:MAG: hypothetical protein M1821_001131 [Bathelium mastoideum]|nr:MAG: hypothetical protein M1821_001131 [Bathelium mastoideum]KAI9693841.1 MAG: hypothetical protein M1822_003112 [Bathelium mastoideum]